MKTLIFLTAILGTVFANQTLSAQSVADERDIQAFARDYMTAYNQQDHEAIGNLYMEKATRINQEGEKWVGRDTITEYFAEHFRQNNTTLLIKQTELYWSDQEHAWVATGTYEIYGQSIVYDIPIQHTGSYANVMVKEKNQWRITKSSTYPLR